MVYTLMLSNDIMDERAENNLLEIQGVLTEFKNIIPKESPQRLPYMRDIQHWIDLILGSDLSNKPTYRLNLKDSK